jgi:hypothetical protein
VRQGLVRQGLVRQGPHELHVSMKGAPRALPLDRLEALTVPVLRQALRHVGSFSPASQDVLAVLVDPIKQPLTTCSCQCWAVRPRRGLVGRLPAEA